jgi:hypothetical protein
MPTAFYIIPTHPAPRWANAYKTAIDIYVIFPHLGKDPVLYTAAKSDPGWEHSEEIFQRASTGEFGEVAPYVVTETATPTLTARQLRIGLLRNGVTADMIIQHINQIPDATQREEARLEWEYATEYQFEHPLVALIAMQLGRAPEEVKAAWVSWATI